MVTVTFDEQAQRVLQYTREEATRRHDPFVTLNHLFLGLVRATEGGAGRLLAELGIGLDEAREQLRAARNAPPQAPSNPGWVVAWAEEEAGRLGHPEVRTEHLLLGFLAVPTFGGAAMFARMLAYNFRERHRGGRPETAWARAYEQLGVPLE